MPIYEYACRVCGNEFETIVAVSAPAPPCPKCDGEVEKKVSLSSFQLKGGGWYADAYSGKDNKGPGSSSSSSTSSGSASSKTSSTSSSSTSSSSDSSTSSGSSSGGSSGD